MSHNWTSRPCFLKPSTATSYQTLTYGNKWKTYSLQWLSQVSAGRPRPRHPWFANSLFPSWDSCFVSQKLANQPRRPWTKTMTPTTTLGAGTRASKIQDGEDVDVMRSSGLSQTEMQQCSSDKCKLFTHENVSKKLSYCINCVINSSKQTLWIFNFKVRKYNEIELYHFRKISNNNELFKRWITLRTKVRWVLKGSACCSKAVDDCPEVKIDGQLVPSVYLPKGKLRLKFCYSTGEPHFD